MGSTTSSTRFLMVDAIMLYRFSLDLSSHLTEAMKTRSAESEYDINTFLCSKSVSF